MYILVIFFNDNQTQNLGTNPKSPIFMDLT